ncbi:hypothetical protein GOODEAATRI_005329 [Goodea atripinnis]|uniref:Uncharacterized protein n=1 Tax=Goodea atripinnis TaxID=208336 RepID=A0ABV0P1X0_9TELE
MVNPLPPCEDSARGANPSQGAPVGLDGRVGGDQRRLISRVAEPPLLALSWRTIAPFLWPDALMTQVCLLFLTSPAVVPLFSQQQQLFSPVPRLHGKFSGGVCVSAPQRAVGVTIYASHRALRGSRTSCCDGSAVINGNTAE